MPTLFVQCGGHGDQSMAPPSRAKIFCNGSSLQHTVSTLLYTTQFKSTISWILPQTGNIGCYRYKTHFRLRSLPFHSTLQQIKFFVTCHRFRCLNLLTDFGRACLWVTAVFHFFALILSPWSQSTKLQFIINVVLEISRRSPANLDWPSTNIIHAQYRKSHNSAVPQ